MNRSKRLILSLVLALLLGGVATNAALAHVCNNPNINDNALVATVTFNADFEVASYELHKDNGSSVEEAIVHGAWVKLVFPWGDSFNVFVRKTLPDGALDSGPGENGCDGKGIDDIDACLAMFGT